MLVTSEQALPKASKEKEASSCLKRPAPTRYLNSTPGMSLPLPLCPGAYRGQGFTDPISIWPGLEGTSDRQDVFLACHFTRPILYSYCTDPVTFCIWYLRHNLSISDTAGLFFLCKYLFTCPFVSPVVQFLSLGFGLRCEVCTTTSIEGGGGTME